MGPPRSSQRHGGCVAASSKTAGTGFPASYDACFMQILGSGSLFFHFSLTEEANSGQIWKSGQECVLVTKWAWLMSMV